jgi:hypothetical protein
MELTSTIVNAKHGKKVSSPGFLAANFIKNFWQVPFDFFAHTVE